MDALKQHFEMPGFKNIVTYIQSGNVMFDTKEPDESKLRIKIEKQLAKQLGYEVPTIVRSFENIKNVITNSPFKDAQGDKKLYIHFLSDVPAQEQFAVLEQYKTPGEELKIRDREVYLLTASYGNTKLSNTLIEKKLGVVATTRNWATVNKVLQL